MRLLLDSHILLWWAMGDSTLTPATVGLIASPQTEVLVSVVSVWELGLKRVKGKLTTPSDYAGLCRQNNFIPLDVTMSHAEAAVALPPIHFDPFDRMLVAQCLVEKATIVTRDRILESYGVPTIAG